MVFAIVQANSTGKSFNLDVEQAFRHIHIIRSGLQHFRHFSSSLDAETISSFSIFLGGDDPF